MKPESAIQRQVIAYLARHSIEVASIPNGSHLAGDKQARFRQVAAMKADGLRVGFPDLILFPRWSTAIGFVEIKTEGGCLSDNQKHCHAWLAGLGHRVAVVHSIEDMAETLDAWGWTR